MARRPTSKLVYQGASLRIEFYVSLTGETPAETWLESQTAGKQEKFAALFAWMGDQGKIWNERKFSTLRAATRFSSSKPTTGEFFVSSCSANTWS